MLSPERLDTNIIVLTLGIDIESLFARSRVCANDGMSVDNWLSSLNTCTRSCGVDLLNARVRCFETMQSLLEQRTEALISRNGVDEKSVATSFRPVKNI